MATFGSGGGTDGSAYARAVVEGPIPSLLHDPSVVLRGHASVSSAFPPPYRSVVELFSISS